LQSSARSEYLNQTTFTTSLVQSILVCGQHLSACSEYRASPTELDKSIPYRTKRWLPYTISCQW